MLNAGLDEAQAGIKIARTNINNLRYADDTTPPLWQKVKGNSRASWWGWKRRVEKAGLKFNIKKTKIMASCLIISWPIDGETMETVTDFILLASKITADGDCSHEIKRCLLLGKKAMENLDDMLKSRDITLPTKIHIVKAVVFPLVMYECESWPKKKAKHWRIDVFELWYLRRLLRVPWLQRDQTSQSKGNQSWIIGKTDAEAEAPVLWPPDAKSWLIRKAPDAGKDWRQEEKGMTEDEMAGWHHRLNGHEFKQAQGDGEGQGNLACCSPWGCKKLDMTEWLNNN